MKLAIVVTSWSYFIESYYDSNSATMATYNIIANQEAEFQLWSSCHSNSNRCMGPVHWGKHTYFGVGFVLVHSFCLGEIVYYSMLFYSSSNVGVHQLLLLVLNNIFRQAPPPPHTHTQSSAPPPRLIRI